VVDDLFDITASFRRPWHAPPANAPEVGVTRFQSIIVFDVPKKKNYFYLPNKIQSYLLSRTRYLFGNNDDNNDEQ